MADGGFRWPGYTWGIYPHQQAFHDSPALYRLLGGAAGPGKSESVLAEAVRLCMTQPGCNGVLFRRTYSELEESLIMRFRRPPALPAQRSSLRELP